MESNSAFIFVAMILFWIFLFIILKPASTRKTVNLSNNLDKKLFDFGKDVVSLLGTIKKEKNAEKVAIQETEKVLGLYENFKQKISREEQIYRTIHQTMSSEKLVKGVKTAWGMPSSSEIISLSKEQIDLISKMIAILKHERKDILDKVLKTDKHMRHELLKDIIKVDDLELQLKEMHAESQTEKGEAKIADVSEARFEHDAYQEEYDLREAEHYINVAIRTMKELTQTNEKLVKMLSTAYMKYMSTSEKWQFINNYKDLLMKKIEEANKLGPFLNMVLKEEQQALGDLAKEEQDLSLEVRAA